MPRCRGRVLGAQVCMQEGWEGGVETLYPTPTPRTRGTMGDYGGLRGTTEDHVGPCGSMGDYGDYR